MTKEEEQILIDAIKSHSAAINTLAMHMSVLSNQLLETKQMITHLIQEKITSDALIAELTGKLN